MQVCSAQAPDQLEALISYHADATQRHGTLVDKSSDAVTKGYHRDLARMHAARVAQCVAMRSPDTVRRMEAERGIV